MATRTVPHAYPMSSEYEFANPSKIYDQNFGEGVSPSEILAPALYHGYYIRPRINKQLERGTSEICLNQHKFQVFLDVCQFLPDELSVRTVDNLLEVVGQHPQKADRHGFIAREFTRTYILPLDVDPLLVRATLSHDGILSIVAPRTGKELKARVNEVKITQQEHPDGQNAVSEAKFGGLTCSSPTAGRNPEIPGDVTSPVPVTCPPPHCATPGAGSALLRACPAHP
uniref:SHSP domain-containing protein n=1 Tax=Malurus cyaneus samueli TaxID=2593467 RepID=A0A8C5TBV1_9PASS